ncbi:MAG: CBS domain-containing protein [Nitrospirae bacterium]|nr:CBS domain-containing protein [Nitrospirota bacterium]
MKTVRDILKKKGSDAYSISPQATVYEALQVMADKNIGAVLVIEKGKLVGIFSERDYARKVILKGKASKETLVSDLMTKNILYVSPDKNVEDCMFLMTTKHVRHLPVMEDDRLEGIISINDVVKIIISEQKFAIDTLEKYMQSSL